MRYVVLGPVTVTTDAGPVILERPQRRAVLALLVLNANQVVSVEQLIEALWGGAPPATARAQLHALIAAVRRSLRDAGAEDAIATRAGGYVLTVGAEESDLRQFEALTNRARNCADPREAGALLRDGLGLWSGAPLDGVSAAFVEPARARLEESRLAAQEQLIEIELNLGRHRELVPELTALVTAHPLRERLVGQLMVALYRSGRQSEALQAGRALRRRLADDEGLDPGPELLELETAILRADPTLAAPAAAPTSAAPSSPAPAFPVARVPRQLPPQVELVGRADELATMDSLVVAERTTPVTAVLTGAAGVGTTALAVHWAYRRIDCFPDGQVYVDGSLAPAEAIGEVLRAFGVPADDLPTDEREAEAAYQGILATRQALVLVDDVANGDLVRTLVPARGTSMVLATSTTRLEVGTAVPVRALPADGSVELLGTLLGSERIDTEADAARMLADQYGHLPLALLVAGANLAEHPDRSVYQQVALGGVHLAGTTPEQGAVAAAFAVAYADLDAVERRLLDLVARAPGRDVSEAAAAALVEVSRDEAHDLLRRLVGAHLLTDRQDGRFGVHPRLRALTGSAPAATDDADAALDRLAAHYLVGADHAARLLYPHLTRLPVPGADGPDRFETAADALRWLDAEHVNLVATIEHAATTGRGATAWLLADTLRGYYSLTMRVADWRRSADAALAAAEAYGSAEARSAAHLSLAELHLRSSRHPGALRDAWQVLATTGRPQAGVPGLPVFAAPARKRPATSTRLLLAVLGVLALCTSAATPNTLADTSETGPGRPVYRWSVGALRQHEGIDFDDAGRLAVEPDPGIDIMPWATGNQLSGKADATIAWAPDGRTSSYDTCARIPKASRAKILRGLHDARDGRRLCVYTKPGHVVLVTLTHAPRMREPDMAFTYVVWQGTAPDSVPPPVIPEGTELSHSAVTLRDVDGIDIDAEGAIVSQDNPGVDATPYGKGTTLRVDNGALVATLPPGSAGTYAACAHAPGPLWVVAAGPLRDMPRNQRLCLRSYEGRVAMLTLVRPTTDDDPDLSFNLVIWQGPPSAGPPVPAPWVRDQYPNGDKTEKKDGAKPPKK